jgi:hypothetical protein
MRKLLTILNTLIKKRSALESRTKQSERLRKTADAFGHPLVQTRPCSGEAACGTLAVYDPDLGFPSTSSARFPAPSSTTIFGLKG